MLSYTGNDFKLRARHLYVFQVYAKSLHSGRYKAYRQRCNYDMATEKKCDEYLEAELVGQLKTFADEDSMLEHMTPGSSRINPLTAAETSEIQQLLDNLPAPDCNEADLKIPLDSAAGTNASTKYILTLMNALHESTTTKQAILLFVAGRIMARCCRTKLYAFHNFDAVLERRPLETLGKIYDYLRALRCGYITDPQYTLLADLANKSKEKHALLKAQGR